MPNWVFCTVAVVGKPDLVEQVKEIMAQPYETWHKEYVDGKFVNVQGVHESVFSFWNIVSPEDTHTYFYGETAKTDLENFAESFTKNEAEGKDWYFWNLREWGCKWDACNAYIEPDDFYPADKGDEKSIYYKFETPWAPPIAAIEKFVAKFPELTVSFDYEEEQGWGGEMTWVNGELTHSEEWDIPQSHADEMARKDYCSQCDDGHNTLDIEFWYNDCPRPSEEEMEAILKENEGVKEKLFGLTENDESGTVVL